MLARLDSLSLSLSKIKGSAISSVKGIDEIVLGERTRELGK